MMYLKTVAGANRWDVYVADNVRYDSTFYQVPSEVIEATASADEVPGFDVRQFFIDREIEEARDLAQDWVVCMPFLKPKLQEKFEPYDDCIRWALREHEGKTCMHVFQGDAYILGKDGDTLEKI